MDRRTAVADTGRDEAGRRNIRRHRRPHRRQVGHVVVVRGAPGPAAGGGRIGTDRTPNAGATGLDGWPRGPSSCELKQNLERVPLFPAPAYDSAMSRIGPFADDDAAAWVVKSPDIGIAMAGFTNAVYNKNRLPMRVRELARMVIALDNECVTCQNTRDSAATAAGADEDLYDHAAEWRTWPGYSPQERIAAEVAERFATDHTGLRDDEDFWDRASEHFSDELMAGLALSCRIWLGTGSMLLTLDIGQSC